MSASKLTLAFDMVGLTPVQKLVLLYLAELDHLDLAVVPYSAIARFACISKSGAMAAVEQLAEKGLLLRVGPARYRVFPPLKAGAA
jgi:DNA-binding MarR family transcriptional regulator